jgi:uncharacterized repeat protein (TIGR03803 family)
MGASPIAGLTLGTDGNFYGPTYLGGAQNGGTVLKLTPAGAVTILYSFCTVSCYDGVYPATPLVLHTNGKLYGNSSGNSLGGGVFYSFDVGLKSFAGLLTWMGKTGKTVEMIGQGFTGTTKVSFDGTAAATFKVVSDTYLTATLPAGATTGFVTVTTPTAALKSNRKFLVTPSITSLTPTSGPVGTPVTITGTSFTGATRVAFGATRWLRLRSTPTLKSLRPFRPEL